MAFESDVSNLVPGDTNVRKDILVHNFLPNTNGDDGAGGCFSISLIQNQ
jgi:hypothetical protein